MTDSELIESNYQLIAGWQLVAIACPESEVLEMDGLSVVWANIGNPLYNAIFLSQPLANEAELEARTEAACHYASQYDRSWLLFVCNDYLPEPVRNRAAEILSRHKLIHPIDLQGMVADELLPPKRPLPPELKCVAIDSLETRRAIADINAICYNTPLPDFREPFERKEFWDDAAVGSVGYVEDKAVSAAAILAFDDCLCLALVATLPDYRSKGYAETAIRHCLALAREKFGDRRLALHATPSGFPLYLKLGYRPVASFSCYLK